MSRVLGPTCKKCRQFGVKLCSKPTGKCSFERKRGQHGRGNFGKKKSDYGKQLLGKQKTKFIYGLKERQFANYYSMAATKKGSTGDILLGLLESRLDNVIYRLGFATTRPQARQGVNHRHFKINDKRVDIPSYLVKPGDKISWSSKATKSGYFDIVKPSIGSREVPKWLKLDADSMSGEVVSVPAVDEEELGLDIRMVVEFYSRR